MSAKSQVGMPCQATPIPEESGSNQNVGEKHQMAILSVLFNVPSSKLVFMILARSTDLMEATRTT